jgi:hypothetical protein
MFDIEGVGGVGSDGPDDVKRTHQDEKFNDLDFAEDDSSETASDVEADHEDGNASPRSEE